MVSFTERAADGTHIEHLADNPTTALYSKILGGRVVKIPGLPIYTLAYANASSGVNEWASAICGYTVYGSVIDATAHC